MNKLRKSIGTGLLIVVAGSFVSLNAQAGKGCSHGPAPFADFDKDGSGFVSEEEFNTTREARMAAMEAKGKKMRGAANAPAFADIDTDGDGQLSQDELNAAHKAHMEKNQAMHKGDGMGQGSGKGHCGGSGKGMDMKGKMPTFADFDLDGDGKIIEQEFNTAHAKKMSEMEAEGRQMKHVGDAPGFAGIDTNNDGEISEQEFATHQAEHHKQMHESKHQSEQGKSK